MTAFKTFICGLAFTISATGLAVAQDAGAQSADLAAPSAPAPQQAANAVPPVAAAPAPIAPINAMVYEVQPPASGAPLSLRPPRGAIAGHRR